MISPLSADHSENDYIRNVGCAEFYHWTTVLERDMCEECVAKLLAPPQSCS